MLNRYLEQTIRQRYQTATFDVQMLRLAKNTCTRKIITAGIRQSLQEAAGLEIRLKSLQKQQPGASL